MYDSHTYLGSDFRHIINLIDLSTYLPRYLPYVGSIFPRFTPTYKGTYLGTYRIYQPKKSTHINTHIHRTHKYTQREHVGTVQYSAPYTPYTNTNSLNRVPKKQNTKKDFLLRGLGEEEKKRGTVWVLATLSILLIFFPSVSHSVPLPPFPLTATGAETGTGTGTDTERWKMED